MIFQEKIYMLGKYIDNRTMYSINYLEIFSNALFSTECKMWSLRNLSPNLKSVDGLQRTFNHDFSILST